MGTRADCGNLALGQTDEERRYIVQVERALGLSAGALVADIGTCDVEFHPLHISKTVGTSGRLVCVDVDSKALDEVKRKLAESGATNVKTEVGKPDDPLLSDRSFDAVLIARITK